MSQHEWKYSSCLWVLTPAGLTEPFILIDLILPHKINILDLTNRAIGLGTGYRQILSEKGCKDGEGNHEQVTGTIYQKQSQ